MKVDDTRAAQKLIERINRCSIRPIRLMEFCGGHTVAILRYGLRQLLQKNIIMSSGPGCPVCVTATRDIDKIIELSRKTGVITATFGDLMRVPGSFSSLQQSRAEGNDIRVVYSALEALDLARQFPDRQVVMVGIGFETTAPTIAVSVLQAQEEQLKNYRVLSLHKLTPPAITAILKAGETRIDGIICPGHVCAITGSQPFEFISSQYGLSGVVTGFELRDILLGISMLIEQIIEKKPEVKIAYRRAVQPGGNTKALELMNRVFSTASASWRGLGVIPESGLQIKSEFEYFDAEKVFNLSQIETHEPAGCSCGQILRGVKVPTECALFGTVCTPDHPTGPCMVSAEGACSAYYLYGGANG
jgi:hydrogenase expression/formation protein HypD